jgi:hydrogenase maturation protein HypF
VQGVGFRRTIWRLAGQHRLTGEVWNDGLGVMIHAFGSEKDLDAFIKQIPLQLPPLARLDSLEVQSLDKLPHSEKFCIVATLKQMFSICRLIINNNQMLLVDVLL